MNWLVTWLILITVLTLLMWGHAGGERMYQFPLSVGVKMIGFSITCLAMRWFGWSAKTTGPVSLRLVASN
jgi:hypothetical protein